MSLWDDYKFDAQFARDFPHGVNNDEWTTREGKVLKVKDMTTAHIKNCMRMLGGGEFCSVFEQELKRRGESFDSGATADFAAISKQEEGKHMNGMTFCNGWSQEQTWQWVKERKDLPHKRDVYNNGYKLTWENGDTYEIEYGCWQPRVPGRLRINGELVYTEE